MKSGSVISAGPARESPPPTLTSGLVLDIVTEKLKFVLALGGFLALLAGFVMLGGYAIYYDVGHRDQRLLAEMLSPRLELILGLGALGLTLFGFLFVLAYQAYVTGVLKVVEGLRIILDAHRGHRIPLAGPAHLRILAETVNQFAQQHEALARDLEAKAIRARASVEEEKNRLAALMSELSIGVLVCNIEGRILLYNERARQALAAATESRGDAAAALIGLGRSIFAAIDRNLLVHALESVRSRLEKDEADLNTQFVTTTRAGQLIRAQMAPVLTTKLPPERDGSSQDSTDRATLPPLQRSTFATISGFVLTMENITRQFERETRRDTLLRSLTEGSRSSLANIRAAVETLLDYPDCEAEQHDRFIHVINEEVRNLSSRLDETTADYADSLKTRWPLEQMLGVDIVAAARRRIESRLELLTKGETLDGSLWIRADSYMLIQALTYFAGRLKDEFEVGEVRFNLSQAGRLAQFDLIGAGVVIPPEALYAWEIDPMRAGGEDSPLTLRDVTERHGAELVFIADRARQRTVLRLLLPLTAPAHPSIGAPIRHGDSRPEFYDFDLFRRGGQTSDLDERALTELSYTVFDTETTGLEPSCGDEIVSIAAVRIVNNRLLKNETYQQLVDPRRPASSLSVSIHGLTRDMLRGQPTIEKVLPRFYEFCEDTVLVGHNAAFDMRFLQLKEQQSGLRFTQPVLDTLLLSEVLHPNQESHTLEAIAERFGVPVLARHTALGDATATGEVFLRMIPLLAAQGIRTLRDAREAAQRTLYAKVEY